MNRTTPPRPRLAWTATLALLAMALTSAPAFAATAPAATTLTAAAVSPTDLNVSLSWAVPSDGGAPIDHYIIIRFTGGAYDFAWQINGGSTTTATLQRKYASVDSTWQIKAHNSVGDGPYSNAATVPCSAAPLAPSGVTATQTNTSNCAYGVDVKWSPPPSSSACPILEYTVPYTADGVAATASAGTTPSIHFPVTAGVKYAFTVTARNSVGTGPATAAVAYSCANVPFTPTPTPFPAGTTVPPAPTLKATAVSPTDLNVNLSWVVSGDGGAPIDHYIIIRFTGGTYDFAWQINGASTTTATLSRKSTTIDSSWQIKAHNAVGDGPYSSMVTVPGSAAAPTPTVTSATPTPTPAVWTNFGGQTVFASISAGSASKIAGTSAGSLLHWTGAGFAYENPAVAMVQTSIAADGTWWGVKADGTIWRYSGSSWTSVPGALKQISVGSASNIWGVNATNSLYKWNGTGWALMGAMSYIAAAADGTVWGITTTGAIVQWNGSSFVTVPGAAVQVSVGSASVVWVVNSAGTVYRWNGSGWETRTDAGTCKAVSAAADGTVLAIRASDGLVYRKP